MQNVLGGCRKLRAKGKPLVSKKDVITVRGTVVEVLPNANFRVKLNEGADHAIAAYTTGPMRKKRIRVMLGDNVTVELSAYDPSRGRIVYRNKLP